MKLRNGKAIVLVLSCNWFILCGSLLGAGTTPAPNAASSASLRAMARVYMACGQYKTAKPLLEQALTLARATNAPDAELCACLIDSAYLYDQQGKLSRAERLCRSGLQLQEKVYRPNHPYVAYTLRILAEIYRKQGRYLPAKNALDRAMTIMRAARPNDDQQTAPFKVDMARLLTAEGELSEAESCFKEALPVISRSFGPAHLYTAQVQSSLAALYASEGRYAQADALISKALPVYEKVHGPDHPFLVPLWLTKARIDQGRGDTTNAKMLLEKSLRVVRNHDDSGPLIAAKVRSRLGEFYLLNKNYAKAEVILTEALKILERSQNTGSNCEAVVLTILARVHRKTGDTAQVARLEHRVEEIRMRQQVAYVPVAKAVE